MEHLHVTVEVNGVKLEVIGNYWPGEDASWDSPGEPESVEIESVLTEKGDDIGGLLGHCSELAGAIKAMALEEHVGRRTEMRYYLAEEENIRRREMAREAA